MKKNHRIALISILSFIAFSSGLVADDDITNGSVRVKGTKKQDYVQLAKITLEQAIQKALKEVPGKAVEAELDEEDGFLVYSVKIVSPDKKVTKLEIDAGNESVLLKKNEGKFWD